MAEENYRCAQKLDLSHPEILESSTICSLLKQRGVAEDVLKAASRTEQLNLYYKIVLPLPQRQYRDNRRGKLFGRKTAVSSEKTVSSSPKEKPNAPCEKSEPSIIKLSRLVNLPKVSNTESPRLKPPPITINSERKTIKLSCKREFSGSALVTSKSNNPQTTEQESGRKIIRLINDTLQSNIRHSNDKRKSDSLFARKSKDVVSLKGNRCSLTGNNLSSKKVEILSEESSAEESPKKKHRPITWP